MMIYLVIIFIFFGFLHTQNGRLRKIRNIIVTLFIWISLGLVFNEIFTDTKKNIEKD